jgi:hypothetical protein
VTRVGTGRCVSCTRTWVHCHGTAVVHTDGAADCTSAGCSVPVELHVLRVSCAELTVACGCP